MNDVLEALRGVSAATITLQLLKRGFRNCFIRGARPLNATVRPFVAEAYTLRFIPMREDLSRPEALGNVEYPPRKAIEAIPPGQALVIDCRGELGAGVAGGLLATRLRIRGAAAMVADGPMRDAGELAAMDFPVYCAGGAAPASITLHFGAGLQEPIACGGAAVFPGDLVAGDADGVVVIPRVLAGEIARDAGEQERLEAFLLSRIEAGRPIFGTYPPNEETLREYEAWKRR
jgi:regulator of RNase E activity RraA